MTSATDERTPLASPRTGGPAPGGSTWEVLAGVRFALALIVACGHLTLEGPVSRPIGWLAQGSAFTAVLCFLVISGYSIAQSLARGSNGFYRRRFVRVYPLYAVAVLYGLAAYLLDHPFQPSYGRSAVGNLAFLQTFVASPAVGNGAVWTLAVEAACYAAAPLLARLGTASLLTLAGASGVAYLAVPPHVQGYYQSWRYGGPLLVLGWAWLAGFIYHRHQARPAAGVLLLGGLVGLTTLNDRFCSGYSPVTVVATVALMAGGGSLALPALARRALAYAGDLSYPLYLYHFPTFYLFYNAAHYNVPTLALAASLAVSAALLAVDARIKRPLTAALDRLVARRLPPTAPPTAPSDVAR